jgi:hypothetical protein
MTEYANLDAALTDHAARCQSLHRECWKRNAPQLPAPLEDPLERIDLDDLVSVKIEREISVPLLFPADFATESAVVVPKTEPPIVRLPNNKKISHGVVCLPKKNKIVRGEQLKEEEVFMAELADAEATYLPLLAERMSVYKY